jgi:hypothetical protein
MSMYISIWPLLAAFHVAGALKDVRRQPPPDRNTGAAAPSALKDLSPKNMRTPPPPSAAQYSRLVAGQEGSESEEEEGPPPEQQQAPPLSLAGEFFRAAAAAAAPAGAAASPYPHVPRHYPAVPPPGAPGGGRRAAQQRGTAAPPQLPAWMSERMVKSLTSVLLELPFSRRAETEADLIGARAQAGGGGWCCGMGGEWGRRQAGLYAGVAGGGGACGARSGRHRWPSGHMLQGVLAALTDGSEPL